MLSANTFFCAVFKPRSFGRRRSPVPGAGSTRGVFSTGAFGARTFSARSMDYTSAAETEEPVPAGPWTRRPRSSSPWVRVGRDSQDWTPV